MSVYTSFDFPFTEGVAAFNAVLPHAAGKNEPTRVITGVRLTAEGNLVATDRYTVGRYRPDYESHDFLRPRKHGDDFPGATLPVEAVKWITAMRATKLAAGKYSVSSYAIRLVVDLDAQMVKVALVRGVDWERYDDHEDDVDAVEQSAQFALLGGNFPPVDRLFPNETTKFGTDAVSLKMDLVMRIATATKWLGDRNDVARFQFTQNANSDKPGPVFVTVGDRFDSLIQPNLLLR